MKIKKWAAVLVTLVAILALGRDVRAQSDTNKAAAEALFDEGRQLMSSKSYADACDKFERSQQLDPSVGALLSLGDCLEKMNKMASAWTRYKEAGNLAAKLSDPRAGTAAERAKAIQPKVSRLTVRIPAAAKVDGLEVALDGNKLAPALIGAPSPIDAGTHVVSATAPGKKAWKQDVSVAEAEGKAVDIPVLGADDGSAPSETPTAAPVPSEGAAPSAGTEATTDQLPKKKLGTRKIIALVAGGVGVVGIGVGTFLALGAKSKYNDAKSHCTNGTSGCDAEAASMSKDAKSQATLATVGFGVGIAGLAAGAVLWFTAPKEKATGARARRRVAMIPLLSPGMSGLVVEGMMP